MQTKTDHEQRDIILEEMRKRLGEEITRTWFSRIEVDSAAGKITVPVYNNPYRQWVQSNYAEVLSDIVRQSIGTSMEIVFEVRRDLPPPVSGAQPCSQRDEGPSSSTTAAWEVPTSSVDVASSIGIELSDDYTFETFVVGPCNRLPHAAALAVSEAPGRAYNPLFLHGGVGLGKTHLLQAICHRLLQRNSGMKVLYLPCDTFVNHFIAAITKGNTELFRQKYRHLDVLLIDDIHFLAGKESTQNEFFHTFNTLYNAQKQIILSSDSPPGDIPTLEERLVSRFKWGLVAKLEAPDFETRVAILKTKSRAKGIELPDKVCEFIAEHFTDNVRVLEGAINRIIGYAALQSCPIDLSFAKKALKDIIEEPREPVIDIDDIQRLVCSKFSIKLSDLQSKRRSKSVAFPRQVSMYLARLMTKYSLEEIGGFFGGKDHTTVIYACEKIKEMRDNDPQFNAFIESLISRLKEKV